MDINGWKDGKFDPDSQEPDYDFMFGKTPQPEIPGLPIELPEIDKQKIQKNLLKNSITNLFKFLEEQKMEITVDEAGNFIFIDPKNSLDIPPPA